jgi:tRNA G26 N,N-dimethylase Trm1
MCTATDMAVLCGTNGEVCYSKYVGTTCSRNVPSEQFIV